MIGVILMEEWLIHSNMGIGCTCCKTSIKLCKIVKNFPSLTLPSLPAFSRLKSSCPWEIFLALLHRCNVGSTLFPHFLCISSQKLDTALQFPIPTNQHPIFLLILVFVGGSSFFSLPTSSHSVWEVLSYFPLPLSTTVFIFLSHYFLLI